MKMTTLTNAPEKPLPHPTPLSQPYWDAAAEGRLVIQKCASCGKLRHYPRLLCDNCYSDAAEWTPASGRGKVHSWTVCHHAFHPAFAGELPYTLVTVDLEEGVRALGRWTGGAFQIGTPVQGRFELSPGRSELVFDPA
jgi:uncharacterized OB-fold protein